MKRNLQFLGLHVCWWVLVIYPTGVNGTLSDPCSPYLNKFEVADMCKASYAVENASIDGNENYDSVLMRVMIQDDNCICYVTVEDPITSTTNIYIKITSAPNEINCGLVIQINKPISQIACNYGHLDSSVPLGKDDVIKFTSKKAAGILNTGYCIQITRVYNYQDGPVLKIACEDPGLITSPQVTETTDSQKLYNQTEQSTVGKEEMEMAFIAIGVGCGFCILIIAISIIILLKRKRSCHTKTEIQDEVNNIDSNCQQQDISNQDYDGLQYNVLYVTAGQQDMVEKNCATVQLERQNTGTQILETNGNNSTQDIGCYSLVHEDMCLPNEHKNRQSKKLDTTSISSVKQNEANNDNYERSSDVYAVVNKRRTEKSTAGDNQTYAVVDKSKTKTDSKRYANI